MTIHSVSQFHKVQIKCSDSIAAFCKQVCRYRHMNYITQDESLMFRILLMLLFWSWVTSLLCFASFSICFVIYIIWGFFAVCLTKGFEFILLKVIGIIKRKALIKDLAAAYHTECLALCRELLELQKRKDEVRYPSPIYSLNEPIIV